MTSVDRLDDLRSQSGAKSEYSSQYTSRATSRGTSRAASDVGSINGDVPTKQPELEPENELLKKQRENYEPVAKLVRIIDGNQTKVEQLKREDREATTDAQRNDILEQMYDIIEETKTVATLVKNLLFEIRDDNNKFAKANPQSSFNQMNLNLYQVNIAALHQAMNQFHASTYEYEQNIEDRTIKQLKIVTNDLNLSDQQLQQIARSGQAQQVIQEVMFSDSLAGIVMEIETRAQQIHLLESHVLEIYELYRDLSTLVQLQEESLEVIDNRVSATKAHTASAAASLKSAEKYQKRGRWRSCIVMLLAVGALFAILIALYGTGLLSFA